MSYLADNQWFVTVRILDGSMIYSYFRFVNATSKEEAVKKTKSKIDSVYAEANKSGLHMNRENTRVDSISATRNLPRRYWGRYWESDF